MQRYLVSEQHVDACQQKPDIYRCIHSSSNRLGFYAVKYYSMTSFETVRSAAQFLSEIIELHTQKKHKQQNFPLLSL